jgi:hypothetical protein
MTHRSPTRTPGNQWRLTGRCAPTQSTSTDLLSECQALVTEAFRIPKRERFPWLIRRLPDAALQCVSPQARESDEILGAVLLYLALASRELLYGAPDQSQRIAASEDEIADWAGLIAPSITFESLRRKGYLTEAQLPANPFDPEAQIGGQVSDKGRRAVDAAGDPLGGR